jgi:hypothetical protein
MQGGAAGSATLDFPQLLPTLSRVTFMEDLTTRVLIEIRDEIRATKDELRDELRATKDELRDELRATKNELRDEIRGTNSRLDRLEKRQSESEIRLGTEIVAVVGAIRELRDTLLEDRQLRQTVDNHETRLRALESQNH